MVTYFQAAIILVIVALIFLFIKIKYIKHKLLWIVLLIIALIFYLTFLASTSGYNISLDNPEGAQAAVKLYLGWLAQSFENTKTITGQAVKLDWTLNNNTKDYDDSRLDREKYRRK